MDAVTRRSSRVLWLLPIALVLALTAYSQTGKPRPISLSPSTVSLTPGQTHLLTSTSVVKTWVSSLSSVATVSPVNSTTARVTAVRVGTTVISAKNGPYTGLATVVVTAVVSVLPPPSGPATVSLLGTGTGAMIDDPTTLSFSASSDHATLTRYESRTRRVSDNVVIDTSNMGLPTPQGGIIQVPLSLGGWAQNVVHVVDVRSVRLPYTSAWVQSAQTARRTTDISQPPGGSAKAFPGAIGFGSQTRHAYAGTVQPKVIRVTTVADNSNALVLNPDGTYSGSFRSAVKATFPRIIIFQVSGYISLTSRLIVTSPYCFIAGATAPSPGISLRNYAFSVQASDVVVQHIRTRVGDSVSISGNGEDGIYVYNSAQRVVLDHLSVAWAVDGSIDATSGLRDITISNCIMAEPLRYNATHGPQLISGASLRNVSTIRNLFAHATTRCPRIADGARAVAINNLIYDSYTSMDSHIDDQVVSTGVPVYASFVSNRSIQGPTGGTVNRWMIVANDRTVTGSKLYHTGNSFSGANYVAVYRSTTDSGFNPASGITAPLSEQPLPTDVPIMASTAVEAHVLANAGARPLNRDPVDTRIITNVTNRTATSTNIQRQSSVGGYPTLANNTRVLTLPANPHAVAASGYTNLEEWLHSYADDLEP